MHEDGDASPKFSSDDSHNVTFTLTLTALLRFYALKSFVHLASTSIQIHVQHSQ